MRRRNHIRPPAALVALLVLTAASVAFAQPQSPNFMMASQTFSAAASLDSTANYSLFSSIGQWSVADTHLSQNYKVTSGFLTPSYGTGTGAFLVVSPLLLDFSEVHVDSTSNMTITLSDTGYWDVLVTGMQLSQGSVFQLNPALQLPDTIHALSSRDYTIRFQSTVSGIFRDTLMVTHDAGDPLWVTMVGTATAPAIAVNPDTLAFGDLWIGIAMQDTFTISNPGSADLHVDSISSNNAIFPSIATPFIVPPGTGYAVPYGIVVQDTLAYSGLLTVHSDAGDPTVSIMAHGIWTDLLADPVSIHLGNVAITDTVDTTVTLESAGNTFVLIDNVHLSADSFSVLQMPADSLPAYGLSTIVVRFIAHTVGTCQDTLIIENSAGDPLRIPLSAGVTSADQTPALIPKDFCLNQNFPNPFNPTTTVMFGLPKEAVVRLEIFDVLGRKVAMLADDTFQPGWHKVMWNGSSCSTGMYILRMHTEDKVMLRKMLLMK